MGENLAIDGGTPVRPTLLPYGRQALDDADIAAVVATLRGDWITTGPRVEAFEHAVAARAGARHAVAVANGTAALHAAIAALDLRPGDEVIVPALTFAATANAALYCGAKPVFADIRADTLNIDPASVEARLGARTRAIAAVDYAGLPAELGPLGTIAGRAGLRLVEDASHALGATYRGRPIGSVADLTTFSFHPVKQVTTGEGGAITTDDSDLAARMRRFRNHGIGSSAADRLRDAEWIYEMVELGFNYRLTDLQCALGLSQMSKLDAFVARRQEIAAAYRRAFTELPGLTLPAISGDSSHAYHLFPVLLDVDRLSADRRVIFRALRAEGIGVNVHYIPVYWHPYYRSLGYRAGICPVAEASYERLLSLPMFPAMTDRDVDDVVTAVAKVLGHFAR